MTPKRKLRWILLGSLGLLLLLSPVWGFELVYLVELRNVPTPVVPASSAPALAQDALWIDSGETLDHEPQVDGLWLGNFFSSFSRPGEGDRPRGLGISYRLARLWLRQHPRNGMRNLQRVFVESSLAVWFTRRASAAEMKQALAEWECFGRNACGLNSAARAYFGRTQTELTVAQIALLVGLPQSPTRFDPTRNAAPALKRRAFVLGRLRRLGLISVGEFESARLEQ